jgi:hypothetical protein
VLRPNYNVLGVCQMLIEQTPHAPFSAIAKVFRVAGGEMGRWRA